MEPVFLELTSMQGKPLLILAQSIVKIVPDEQPHRSLCSLVIAWHGHMEAFQVRESYKQIKERMSEWSSFPETAK